MMFNFNMSPFKGLNVFATSRLANFFENKTEFHLDDFFQTEGVIEEIKLSGQAANNYFAHHTKYTKLFLDYVIKDQSYTGSQEHKYKYPYLASEVFACEINGIIDNFFNDAEVDTSQMTRLKSVDISTIQSPEAPLRPGMDLDEKELAFALEKQISLGDSHTEIPQKQKMGDYLFDCLSEYFENKEEFINPTSAVYFQKVLYALLNKKGFETVKIIFEKKEIVRNCLRYVNLRPLAEIMIRFLLLDSCYSYMNTPIFLTERKEIVNMLFSELANNKDPEVLENIVYILIETINRNTSGNFGREIVAFILEESHIDSIFSRIHKATTEGQNLLMISLQFIHSLIKFCILEETRNNYKSPFVNCEIENEECERLCNVFQSRFQEKIPELLDFVQNKINGQDSVNTTYRQKVTIFGLDRLKVIEILTEVLKFKNDRMLLKMIENDVYQRFLGLFKIHPFHSILHTAIFKFLKQSLELNHEKVNTQVNFIPFSDKYYFDLLKFFEKEILPTFILELSTDDHIRIPLSSKKIPKGYNGYVILLIQMIYDSPKVCPEMIQILENIPAWKSFMEENYTPFLERISFELGGYHPRTKKDNSYQRAPEPDDILFNSIRNYEDGTIVSPGKIADWTVNGKASTNVPGYMEEVGDYDYYFEDIQKYREKGETNGVQKDENIEKEKPDKGLLEKAFTHDEEERLRHEFESGGSSGVMKCRYEYEEDYFLD